MNLKPLHHLTHPAYVLDLARLKANMEVAKRVKQEAGVKLLLATKAFAMPAAFEFMQGALDGTTASGLYEARLGAEHFGKEVHCYSPAFSEAELRECAGYAGHIYFNSVSQLKRFGPVLRQDFLDIKLGLRVNPNLSLVKNSVLYDPSAPASRFGVQMSELTDEVLDAIDILHVHNLCENMAEDSVKLIEHVSEKLAPALAKLKYVNLGGGHYMTHPDFKLDAFIQALRAFQAKHDVEVFIESGGTWVYDAGYLVGEVMDVFANEKNHAVLNISASAHMPDVLEVPYRPNLIGAGEAGEKAYTYTLSGNTCMTGDMIGEYSFNTPLEVGQKLIFTDMMQYSFVKNTTFNGVALPELGMLLEDGSYQTVRAFGYEDFKKRVG